MKYEIIPCGEGDSEYIWEKGFESVPSEGNATQELIVFKVTDKKGTVIGGCVLDIDEMKTAEFDRLWVDANYRGQGIGSALIRKAEDIAREKGCCSIVNTYNFDFQIARHLFERRGYHLAGITKDWPKGHESYTLIKRLDRSSDEDRSANPFEYSEYRIEVGTEEDGTFIADRLEAFNCSFAPRSHAYLEIDKKIADEKGNMIAGCIAGVSGWDTLYIDVLWVDEAYRNQGIGSYLLDEIEREAKENSAYLSRTEGIALQVGFFKKHGYAVNVVFEGNPEWYVMYKHF